MLRKLLITLIVLSIALLGVFAVSLVTKSELAPFASDGCSAFPDGTYQQKELWLSCCQTHDFQYWQGGTYKQRFDADVQLNQCVAQVGEEEIALLMLAGVRVGGTPFLPTQFRWGYGWAYPHLYGELTADELAQIEAMEAKMVAKQAESSPEL